MRNKIRAVSARALLREALSASLPALLAAALLIALPGESRSHGDERSGADSATDPKVCGEWHRGAGETSPLDLVAVKKAYGALRDRVAKSLDRAEKEAQPDPDRPYDAGLPACRGEGARTEAISREKGSRLKGRTFYFVSVADPGRLALPVEVAADPSAQVVVIRARALKDLPEIARAVGRPVSLGGADFAKAIGIRCANTWLRVSENGDAVELHEGR